MGPQGEGPTCSGASALRLLSVLLWLRLLAFFARRLGGGCERERIEPRLQQRGSRFGDAQGAIAMDALLRVITAEVVTLPSEAVLIAHQVGRLRTVAGAVLNNVQDFAHRPFRRGALLHDLFRVANQRRAVGPPKAAGNSLAVGGFEDASRDLGRDKNCAVKDVERDRAGGDFSLEALEAVWAANVCRLDRLLADNVDHTALRGVGYAFARKLQFVDGGCRVVAGNLQQPRLSVEHERAPREACDPRNKASLVASPRLRRRSGRAPVLCGRDSRPLGLGGSGAGEHQLRAGLTCGEGRDEEPANQGAVAS